MNTENIPYTTVLEEPKRKEVPAFLFWIWQIAG